MNDPKRAEVSAKLFHQLSGFNDYALGRLREDLEDLRVLKSEAATGTAVDDADRKLPELSGANADLPYASDKLALSGTREDTTKGRYIVAAQDLKPAEPIVVEPAVGACLYTKFFGSHCNACFAKLVAPVACPECAGVAFCSPECRDRACSGYHRFECHYLDLLIGSGMSVLCHLALRLVTQAGTPEKAIELGAELKRTLCAHEDRREPSDYFQRTLMAAFLLRCLQKAEFFGRRKTEAAEPTPLEAQVGGVILALLQSLQFNAHEIYETKISGEHRIDTAKVQYVGVGVYRTSAMFNHECYPGVSRTFLGTTMCLYTSRPFPAGATIPENYGMHFIRHPAAVRQRTLRSRYWFGCECRACQENWPLMDKLTDKPRMRCPYPDCDNTLNFPQKKDPKVKCWKCKRYANLENSLMMLDQCEDLYTKGARAMADQRIDEAIELLSQGIALFHKLAVPPHKSTHVAEESLRVCFADKGSINRV
ncbi:hypothetical protein pipiens_017691 [Culex pipiens pipiens]|uniref:MYND-type domain-containing protein n=1 Tax=Culex pipiens pipiens TaxID=38569 RepID=A0ABD1CFE5_CULPP